VCKRCSEGLSCDGKKVSTYQNTQGGCLSKGVRKGGYFGFTKFGGFYIWVLD